MQHIVDVVMLKMNDVRADNATAVSPDCLDSTFRLGGEMQQDISTLCTSRGVQVALRVPLPRPHTAHDLYLTMTCNGGVMNTKVVRSLNLKKNHTSTLVGWSKMLYGTAARNIRSSLYILIGKNAPEWYVS